MYVDKEAMEARQEAEMALLKRTSGKITANELQWLGEQSYKCFYCGEDLLSDSSDEILIVRSKHPEFPLQAAHKRHFQEGEIPIELIIREI